MCKCILRGINTSFFYSNHGKQNRKKVWNSQKAFSLRTIKICRFKIINGVKYVYCIKHSYKSEGTIRVCSRSLTLASMCFLFLYEMNSSVQDYNDWTRRKVKAITYLNKLVFYQADCCGYPWSLVCGVSIPGVSDLNRQRDNYDVYPVCHCVRTKCLYSYGSALFTIVHSYTTWQLRRFADFLHARRREPYISTVPVIF